MLLNVQCKRNCLNVLIACEESQVVCKAFRALGRQAYSCDILPCSGGHPEWHLQHDVLPFLESSVWDLIIAHPPCTRLTCAANRWYKPEYADRFPSIHKEREEAIKFFIAFVNVPCPHVAIENPIGIMSTRYMKPSQIIQPYQFGHSERKATCLWLKDLPPLQHTKIVVPEIIIHKSGRTDGKLHFKTLGLPPAERSRIRSKTFPGIAKAMAEQWSKFILNSKKES